MMQANPKDFIKGLPSSDGLHTSRAHLSVPCI